MYVWYGHLCPLIVFESRRCIFIVGDIFEISLPDSPQISFKSERWWVFNLQQFRLQPENPPNCGFPFWDDDFLIKNNTIATAQQCQGWNHFCNWNVRGVFGTGFFDSTKFWEEFWKRWKLQHKIPQHQAISPRLKPPPTRTPSCLSSFVSKKKTSTFWPHNNSCIFRLLPGLPGLSSLPWSTHHAATGFPVVTLAVAIIRHLGGAPTRRWFRRKLDAYLGDQVGGTPVGVEGAVPPRKRKMTSGAHFGVEGTKYPNFCYKQNFNFLYYVFSCLGMWGKTHLIGGNFTYFLEILRPEHWGRWFQILTCTYFSDGLIQPPTRDNSNDLDALFV